MYLPFGSVVAAVAILISIASAANIQARDDVALCKAVLIALKASAFCSSFVPITDKVSTVSSPGTTTQSTVTVIVTGTQCNYKPKKKRTQAVSTAATPKPTTTSSTKCSIKGISPQLNIFACEIIKAACQAYVKPKTTTVCFFLFSMTVNHKACVLNCQYTRLRQLVEQSLNLLVLSLSLSLDSVVQISIWHVAAAYLTILRLALLVHWICALLVIAVREQLAFRVHVHRPR